MNYTHTGRPVGHGDKRFRNESASCAIGRGRMTAEEWYLEAQASKKDFETPANDK